jgi:hypothetical protein
MDFSQSNIPSREGERHRGLLCKSLIHLSFAVVIAVPDCRLQKSGHAGKAPMQSG